jgi:intraflagellar transport protein 81
MSPTCADLAVRGTCRAEFKQLLAAGDRDVVYAVIKWVVAQGPVLEKRTFVGFYLSFPEVGLSWDPVLLTL